MGPHGRLERSREQAVTVALFYFECESGHHFSVLRLSDPGALRCPSCDAFAHRQVQGPDVQVREIIDRPFQVQSFERPVDQRRLIQDRDSEVTIK